MLTSRARVIRAAVAAVALAGALCTESTVDRALAVSAPRAHHAPAHHQAAHKPKPAPHKPKPVAHKPAAHQSGSATPGVPDAAVAEKLPAALDADGAAIDVGYADAPVVLTVFEDYRCSASADFERRQGPTLRGLIASHTARVRYVMESSLDERLPGPGALLASDAARAALAHGGFPLFHALLFANQPDEQQNGFTTPRLLRLASDVPGLRSAGFDAEVTGVAWRSWVAAAQREYDDAHVHHGTPSILLNGQEVDLWAHPELLDRPAGLTAFVRHAAQRD